MRTFLDSKVQVHAGDCLDVIRALADSSIDSVVTDPPYALVSISKRFGAEDAGPAKIGRSGAYARASAGFMGKKWDTGEVAFSVELWREVFRVLKPGGHVVSFGGTRTYHRLACAIEDAGFEIRDQIAWLYGSGFPKSHDVSKRIDKAAGAEREVVGPRRLPNGRPHEYNIGFGEGEGFASVAKANGVTAPVTEAARQWQGWGTALKPAIEPIVLARKPLEGTVAANVLRHRTGGLNIGPCRVSASSGTSPGAPRNRNAGSTSYTSPEPTNEPAGHIGRIQSPGSDCSQGGLGNSLPASGAECDHERQSPLGSQDGCRPSPHSDGEPAPTAEAAGQEVAPRRSDADTALGLDGGGGHSREDRSRAYKEYMTPHIQQQPGRRPGGFGNVGVEKGDSRPNGYTPPEGRWPANVIHDGSDEVEEAFAQFGESKSADSMRGERHGSIYGGGKGPEGLDSLRGHTGTASRFFYSAKADADDRLGSKHPTVKPVDLMQYLIRLVTPKGGTVLDPFSGTGTTGEAAFREGCRAVLIEREAEYLADIERRLEHVLAGPDARRHTIIKTKGKVESAGPLFAKAAE